MHANSLFAKTTAHQAGGFEPGCGQAGYGRDRAIVLVLRFPARPGMFGLQRSSSIGINLQPPPRTS